MQTFTTLHEGVDSFAAKLVIITPTKSIITVATFSGASPAQMLNAVNSFVHSEAGVIQSERAVRCDGAEGSFLPRILITGANGKAQYLAVR